MQNKTESEIRLEILNAAINLASDTHYQKITRAQLLTGENKPYDLPEDTRVSDALRNAKKFSKYVFESDDSKQVLTEG